MSNLHQASSQWATRPADERFWTLRDMRMACETARAGSTVKQIALSALHAEAHNDEIYLVQNTSSGDKARARFTHYAFGQLCGAVDAQAGYLRKLPAPLAAQCLEYGLVTKAATDPSKRDLLLHKNGGFTLRACLSEKYDRVWDDDVCRMLERLGEAGWRAPAGLAIGYQGESRIATAADILPGQINVRPGDALAPSGLYASDHDMFAFLVAPDRVIEGANGHPLMRGIFVRNSEVGKAALSVTFFLMQTVCGNHIVWNATGVREISLRHIGRPGSTLAKMGSSFIANVRTYHDAADVEAKGIAAARTRILGATKEEVLDALCEYAKKFNLAVSRPTFTKAYELAEEHEDWYGNPRSVWGAVSGLTQASQSSEHTDDRVEIDRAAGKLLAMASAV